MNPMRTVSAAVLLAATLIAPAAYAATTADMAKVTMAAKADVRPVANVVQIIGKWTKADLAELSKAGAIKTFDTKMLYPAADQVKIATAQTAKSAELGKFREALRGDAGLTKWFSANKIDINRVIAVGGTHADPHVYLY
ncbi:hypothetical protein [Devosia sp.]|uniref:hypothetical protein n=1 Tax=Devosia sp. TaxID=1871048 RepID=UPI0032647812